MKKLKLCLPLVIGFLIANTGYIYNKYKEKTQYDILISDLEDTLIKKQNQAYSNKKDQFEKVLSEVLKK